MTEGITQLDLDQDYPWHAPLQAQLDRRIESKRLPHALLIHGHPGLGKAIFAQRFAMQLLCSGSGVRPCGSCDRCRMFLNGTHADYARLSPEGDSKVIKIDQVREVSRALSLKSQYGGHKIVLLMPADAMNHNAANSLLKTLEEPTPGSLLILVCAQPYRLPATIRSRCQAVKMMPPDRPAGRMWLDQQSNFAQHDVALSMADGAPLFALELLQGGALERRDQHFSEWQALMSGKTDPVALADKWNKTGASEAIKWLHGWVQDTIRLIQAPTTENIDNEDLRGELLTLAQGMNVRLLYKRLDQLNEALRLRFTNLNTQMAMEEILMVWSGPKG